MLMLNVEKEKELFHFAYEYILNFEKVNEEILSNEITFPELPKPKTINELFLRMLNHSQNKRNMPNTIGNFQEDLEDVLFGFDPKKVRKKYGKDEWKKLFYVIKEKRNKPDNMVIGNKHGYWVSFTQSILSICYYLERFQSIDDFYNYMQSFVHSDPDVKLGLALILSEEIHGYGFALSCDFLKENVSDQFIKPDIHIKNIFKNLGVSNEEMDFHLFRDIILFSEHINKSPYSVDKLFWIVGSGRFPKKQKYGKYINTNRDDFIEQAKRKLII